MTQHSSTEFAAVTQAVSSADMAVRMTLCDAERQPCEVWTRVMGYHRPVASFNPGKQAEFAERKFFTEQRAFQATHD